MRRRASHAVNNTIVFDSVDVPAAVQVDFEVSTSRVRVLHGAEAAVRYRHFFSRALAALSTSAGTGDNPGAVVHSLGALAAWRAGTVEIRADALRRLGDSLLGHGLHGGNLNGDNLSETNVEASACAAALGLAPDELRAFMDAQQRSLFGWPRFGAGEHVVAFLGGFAGLDGPWITPPDAVTAGDEPGTFYLRAGDEMWRADCDIFGARLARADDHAIPEESDPRRFSSDAVGSSEHDEMTARLSVSEYEYVATLTSTTGDARQQGAAVPTRTGAATA